MLKRLIYLLKYSTCKLWDMLFCLLVYDTKFFICGAFNHVPDYLLPFLVFLY
jgi:hypothetical protein